LVVAGRSTVGDVERFRGEVFGSRLEGQVIVVGYTTDDELAALMSGATAFVFPSLYEGFGLAPLEAMACGAPVLSSNAASLPEVVGDAGALLDPLDCEGWSGALRRIAQDTSYRENLSSRSVSRAASFRWSATNAGIQGLLHELAG
jgi:glycosyltransferase involved in cell wall biosynthesis